MIGIVVSRADSASEHIGEHLLDLADWTTHEDRERADADGGGTVYRTEGFELREFEDLHLYLTDTASVFDETVELLVFASRHSGDTGPLLTAHHTGNFGPAEHGGADNELARACPSAHSAVLDALAEYAPEAYEVGMECTHHGPSEVGLPSMFVEVGSAQPQWDDPEAARAVAQAILALRGVGPDSEPEPTAGDGSIRRHLVGFGGGHYAPRFTRIVRETDWAVGHLAADWGLDAVDPGDHQELLIEAFTESAAEFALVDGAYPDLTDRLRAMGYRVVGERWLREVNGVPLALVDRLEDALGPISEGVRVGTAASDVDPDVDFEIVDLPDQLLAAANGFDQSATRDRTAGNTLAFETTENGSRVTGRAAISSTEQYDLVINSMVDLLDDTYDSIEREDDTVVARELAFDPAKARALGVPEGPEFGRLADGNPVEIDGERIEPEQVRSERCDRFPV